MSKDDIDVEILIKAVEERPAIWNKFSVDYAVRKKKKAAWDEICQIFFDDYHRLSDNLKNHRSRTIINRWQNIRDNWIKCYKKMHNLATKYGTRYRMGRKYIFYDQIKFLLPTMDECNTSQNCESESNMQEYNFVEEEYDIVEQLEDQKPIIHALPSVSLSNNEIKIDCNDRNHSSTPKNLKDSSSISRNSLNDSFPKKRSRDEFDNNTTDNNLLSLDNTVNEDKSFLESLLPTLDKFDDDEKIEFRIEVLQLIKRIKSERLVAGVNKDPLESSNVF